MNAEKLKECIKKKGLTVEEVSTLIGIDRATFYRKLAADAETFTVKQVRDIVTVLNINEQEALSIFFYR